MPVEDEACQPCFPGCVETHRVCVSVCLSVYGYGPVHRALQSARWPVLVWLCAGSVAT